MINSEKKIQIKVVGQLSKSEMDSRFKKEISLKPIIKTPPPLISKDTKKYLLEIRAKVGFTFDKLWKEDKISRETLKVWAISKLKLKNITPSEFQINKLSESNIQKLSLLLKFNPPC